MNCSKEGVFKQWRLRKRGEGGSFLIFLLTRLRSATLFKAYSFITVQVLHLLEVKFGVNRCDCTIADVLRSFIVDDFFFWESAAQPSLCGCKMDSVSAVVERVSVSHRSIGICAQRRCLSSVHRPERVPRSPNRRGKRVLHVAVVEP